MASHRHPIRSRNRGVVHLASLTTLALCGTTPPLDAQTRQRDFRGELVVLGRPSAVATSPSGQVWFTTLTGMLYVADSVTGDWRESGETTIDTAMTRALGQPSKLGVGSIDGLAFSDAKHGLAWGAFRREPRSHGPAQVYVTADAGNTWRLVDVGSAFSFNDAYVGPSGEILLAGYVRDEGARVRTVLFRSTDFGSTWTPWPAPSASTPVAAISFGDSLHGVLGALNNELFLTRDRGRTWQRIPTPLDQRAYARDTHDRFARINNVVLANGWLLINQDGHTFRSRSSSVEWHPWAGDELAFFDADVATGKVCALDVHLRFLALDSALVPRPVSAASLLAPAVAAECRGGRLTAMDTEYRLYSIDAISARHSFPLTSGDTVRSVAISRMRGTSLWGATTRFLYGSADSGRTWYRLPYTASTVRGFLPRDDNSLLVWDGHGVNALFDTDTEVTTAVPTLVGADVVNVVHVGKEWIAYGGKQHETAFRVEVAQSFFAGQFRGSRSDGFVAISSDSGKSWREIDRWSEGGPAAIYVSPDASRIVLLSYLGSIRELARHGDRYVATNVLLASGENRDAVPYVQWPFAVYFNDAKQGYVSGSIHHVGNRYFRTIDGGKSWARIDEAEFPYKGVIPFNRRHVGWTATAIHFLEGPNRDPVVDLGSVVEGPSGRIIAVSRMAASDHLLVDVSKGLAIRQVIVDTRAKTWRMLRP